MSSIASSSQRGHHGNTPPRPPLRAIASARQRAQMQKLNPYSVKRGIAQHDHRHIPAVLIQHEQVSLAELRFPAPVDVRPVHCLLQLAVHDPSRSPPVVCQ